MASNSRLEVYWYSNELHCVRLGPPPVQHLFCTDIQLRMLESSLYGYTTFNDVFDRVFANWPEDMVEEVIKELARKRHVQAEQERLLVERRNLPKASSPVLTRLAATLSITPAAVLATYGDLTVGELEAMVEILDRPELRAVEL